MRYCTRCLYPANHPLGLTFDDEGVCSGCRVHEEKDELDWAARFELLRGLVEPFRCRTRTIHDCIVPVSGSRDSYFIVHIVKNVLGLKPLLVSYNRHWNTRVGIRNLAYLRTLFGLDFFQQTISPERVKRITREALRRRGSIYWHVLAGQTVYPVQMAVRFKIPLIIWGAHQGVDQVGMFSHLDEVEMTRKYRKEHDLMGLEAEDLARDSEWVTADDVEPYLYPNDKELAAVGVRGIYLNNYLRWDSKAQHEKMIDMFGYETLEQTRTFDSYNDAECFVYSDLHDYIKFLKWGYGKATDHACRELRLKRITREQGIDEVARFQPRQPARDGLFYEWLGLDRAGVMEEVDRHRDPAVWRKGDDGAWQLADSILQHRDDPGVEAVRLPAGGFMNFRSLRPRAPQEVEDRYVLIGRGHVD